MDEYYAIELIAIATDPAGVGVQPGPPGSIECRRLMPAPELDELLVQHPRRRPSADRCPRPRHRHRDRVRQVHVHLRRGPGGELAVVECDEDRGVWHLVWVVHEMRPRIFF